MSLEYLFSPTKQFTYPSGKLLDGGKIFVYFKDTTNLATLYSPNGSFVSNPILLDANGRASVRADVSFQYRLEIYTNKDVLLYTCEAFCEGEGSGGFSLVIHDGTLIGNGTASSPLGVVNIPLAVNETMTAYEEVVEGENALVLGVNSAWLDDKLEQELEGKVDRTEFEDCCSAVNEALENKLDASAFDLSNYYNKQETNNLLDQRVDRYEFAQTMNWVDQTKQDKLEFGYNENSAISSINNSALAGQGGEGSCPWISGGKEIAEAQTLGPNKYFQVLSSFTLSGDHNHFISVKGGIYRFPNEWEIGSALATTNLFMPQSSMSGYLSLVAFSSYTASIDNTLTANWAYTNSAYSLSLSNFYNKLDASAFSAYTADQGNTYTLVGGDFVNVSSDDEAETTTISVTGVPGQGEIDNVVNTLSSFSGAWNESTTVVQTNSAAWYDGNTEVNSYVQNNSATINNITNTVEGNSAQWARNDGDSAVNEVVRNFSANGTWLTSHQDLSYYATKQWVEDKGYITGVDLTPYQEKSGMTAYQPVSSMTSYYTTGNAYNLSSFFSGEIGNKLDYSAFTAYTATDETYTLVGGKDIGISSDDNEKTTTISYTGTNGDEEVNNFVYNNSASITNVNNSGALWNAVYDLVATYSAKWLINGDV